jgi:hypothetical protein
MWVELGEVRNNFPVGSSTRKVDLEHEARQGGKGFRSPFLRCLRVHNLYFTRHELRGGGSPGGLILDRVKYNQEVVSDQFLSTRLVGATPKSRVEGFSMTGVGGVLNLLHRRCFCGPHPHSLHPLRDDGDSDDE